MSPMECQIANRSTKRSVPWNVRLGWLFVVVACFGCFPSAAAAQWIQEADLVSPIVDSDPFDLLYLNEDGENAILKIMPLEKPLPNPLPTRDMLRFEFATETGEQLQVPYSSIEKYRTFNQILIDEANGWLKEKKYALAFRNLLYVYDHGGKKDDAMVQSLQSCLFLDATENFRAGRFELALSIFEDLYVRNPDIKIDGINKTLSEIVLACYDGILEKDFADGEFIKVRKKIETIQLKYENEAQPLVKKWDVAFNRRADQLMQEAQQFANNGQGRLAHLASRKAEQINPNRDDIKKLQEAILKKFPLVVVGISQPAATADGSRIEHWGSRRVGRLINRSIVELWGLGEEGGSYQFLNGKFTQSDEIGLQYTIELSDARPNFGTPPANAFLISSLLLKAAEPDSPIYDVAWAKILASVEIVSENKVVVNLRTPFVRPEAMLDFPYSIAEKTSTDATEAATDSKLSDLSNRPESESTAAAASKGSLVSTRRSVAEDNEMVAQNGKYRLTNQEENFTTFEINSDYTTTPESQHPVLIEQIFPSASAAVEELIKGNIDVVDRVPVADIARLKSEPGIVVRPYVIPTIHMLVPKVRGELADNVYFRSGLSHAIDRPMLVQDAICDGQFVSGCEEISGPFPIGTEDNDQLSYAYDMKIRPANFNMKLAMVLIELARKPTKKRPEKLPTPKLVLAHSNSSAATEAAAAIARMWNDVGVTTDLRALKPDQSIPPDDQWDVLYLEVSMEEPLTDISKIVGRDGLAKNVSAPVDQTLRLISYASSWRTATAALRRLHRQLATDLSVIPLWQIREHYAYRNTVTGVGRELVHLYQHVERWKIDTYGTDEKE